MDEKPGAMYGVLFDHSQPNIFLNMNVRLVFEPRGRNRSGPVNGMRSLCAALRKRCEDRGVTWFEFGEEVDLADDCLPWIWCWEQRAVAAELAAEGRPFVVGPNVVFMDSRRPRCDAVEAQILDAASCQVMYCHAEWYRALIDEQRGGENRAPIECWPYPIDPIPEPPVFPAEWDVLVFVKSGPEASRIAREALWMFRRATVFRYGEFQRTELYDRARRSRACLYLSDDESGGLVTQELMLAGCPVAGIERGSPLITPGRTGVRVEEWSLPAFARAVLECHAFDRERVRHEAMEIFSPTRIADQVLESLDRVRRLS